MGSNVGCAVVISQFFGAKEYGKMKTAVFTTLISSVVLSRRADGRRPLGTRGLMEMIHTPENIFADGALYLRIYVGGFLFLFLYNVATGIFTSLGDSKTPVFSDWFLFGKYRSGYLVCRRFPMGSGRCGLGNLYCTGNCLCTGSFDSC